MQVQQAPPTKGLSEADQIKAELKKLRKLLNQLEPQARVAKQNPNLNILFALKSAGKDVVNVGWANSAASAQAQIDKFPERYPGWEVKEDEDIDPDGRPDTIV